MQPGTGMVPGTGMQMAQNPQIGQQQQPNMGMGMQGVQVSNKLFRPKCVDSRIKMVREFFMYLMLTMFAKCNYVKAFTNFSFYYQIIILLRADCTKHS